MGMNRTDLTLGRIERARTALRLVIGTRQTAARYGQALPALVDADHALEKMLYAERLVQVQALGRDDD